jgi:RND family efflux transporter MFP subunit
MKKTDDPLNQLAIRRLKMTHLIDDNNVQSSFKKYKYYYLVIIFLVIISSVSLIFFKKNYVELISIKKISKNIGSDNGLVASGYIVARSKAEISPKTVGKIEWMSIEEGQKIEKGQLIAKLESADLEAQRQRIEVSLFHAKQRFNRIISLKKSGFVSMQGYEDIEREVDILSAQKIEINELIKYTRLVSPIDGVVTVKRAFIGEMVAPQGIGAGSHGATLATIVDLTSLEMEADVSEAYVARLIVGQLAIILLDAYPNKPYSARLRQIVPTADRQKGTVKVKISFDKLDQHVLPEMSAKVTLISDKNVMEFTEKNELFSVPLHSITTVKGIEGILYYKDGEAIFLPVEIINKTSSFVSIKNDQLNDSMKIIAYASEKKWDERQLVFIK